MKFHLSQVTGTFLTYEGTKEDTPGVTTFIFKGSPSVAWEPGQYYVYGLPAAIADRRTALRPFTVASAPSEHRLHITTRLPKQPSVFKQKLLELKPGAKVYAAGPFGFFTLGKGKSVFLAGGIGVTPFRSMILELANRGTMPDITLLYANRDEHIPFKQEFDKVAAAHPSFKVHYLTSPERLDAQAVKPYVSTTGDTTYYLSGPKPFVESLSRELNEDLGIAKSQLKHDSFKGYPWPLA